MSDFYGCCGKSGEKTAFSKLAIYADCPPEEKVYSVSKQLAEELSRYSMRQRTMQMEKIICKVLDSLPENPIIENVDVLFNPAYQVDVLKVLCAAYKHKPFRLIWPGTVDEESGTLVYAEVGFADYRTFCLSDYDVNYIGTGGKSK